MKTNNLALLASLLLAILPAHANLDLAKKNGCMSCHTVDKRVVGPAFQEIAAKYAGKPDAEKMLAEKVKKGGKGIWGEIPMPPNGQVKDAEIEVLIKWILGSGK